MEDNYGKEIKKNTSELTYTLEFTITISFSIDWKQEGLDTLNA